MNIKDYMKKEGELPLDNMVVNGGLCSILSTLACIGDSLSSGELESFSDGKTGYHDYYNISWGQFMARDAGIKVHNFSKGGMSAKQYFNFAKDRGFFDKALAAQAYIIALGVNDVSQIINGETVLGSVDDIHPDAPEANPDTFAGNYGRIISAYKAIQPKARFFLMTMPRSTEDDPRAELYDKHAELLYQIAELFEYCYILDLRKYAPVYDEEFRRNFYLAGHLNSAGYRLTALMVESYIDHIIRNNPEDFTQLGFVGTDFHNENFKW